MTFRVPTLSNWFSQALSAINSPKSCAVRCAALRTCRSLREHCYAGIRTLSRWAASGPAPQFVSGYHYFHLRFVEHVPGA